MARKPPRLDGASLSLPERIDVAIVDCLEPALRSEPVRWLGEVGRVGGRPALRIVTAAVLLVGLRTRNDGLAKTGARMLLAHSLSAIAVQWGKNRVDRTRPRLLLKNRRYQFRRGGSAAPELRAFPSGHTAGSVALAAAVAADYPRLRPAAFAASAIVGALQIPRRAHWPSDVLAGALVGLAAGAIGAMLIPAEVERG